MSILNSLIDRARRRARYQRTVAEIRALPINIAADLGIYPGDAERIARRAVYG